MENASKALTIAAGMLFSILIIAIVAMAYNNIKELQGEKGQVEEQEQAVEFNKTYDSFIRNDLRGMEIISVANLIEDYNKREEDNDLDIELEVTLIAEKEIIGAQYLKAKTYDKNQILAAYNGLEGKIAEYTSKTYATGKSIDYFITLRTNELNILIGKYGEGTGSNNVPNASLRADYQAVKDEMSYFKRKIFSCTAEYSSSTGRINKMIITEN